MDKHLGLLRAAAWSGRLGCLGAWKNFARCETLTFSTSEVHWKTKLGSSNNGLADRIAQRQLDYFNNTS